MNCNKENISAFLDGELKEQEVLELKEHLNGCAKCSLYLNELKAVSFSLKQIEPVQISENALNNIMEKIEKEENFSLSNTIRKIYAFVENALASPGFCTAILIALFLNAFILIQVDMDNGKNLTDPAVTKVLQNYSQK